MNTMKKNRLHKRPGLAQGLLAASTLLPLASVGLAADTTATAPATVSTDWQKPAWLTDLGVGAKESYDDNVFWVSGEGLKPKTSWVTAVSPRVGFNFAPLLGSGDTLQTLSLSYTPDLVYYHETPSENYTANKFGTAVKLKTGDFSLGLDNAFLYNDGNRETYTYAVNPSGAAADQYDKYRSAYATAATRERKNQFQDRNTTVLQYDWNQFFVRPTESLLYYGLNTYQYDSSTPGYKGYQNYVNRYDVNGGADVGYKVTPDVAVTLGYRYGSQYQQQFSAAINNNATLNGQPYNPYASSDYQRVLLGLEGKPLSWLTVKLNGGPDFRNYNSSAAVNDKNLVTYYGEAVVTAKINETQYVAVNYKQWQWVSSTGYVPYFDSTYALTYHWSATPKLGLDLGGKLLESDYTSGNDFSGSGPSDREDIVYAVSAGVSYAFCSHLSANLTYNYNLGKNNLTEAELSAAKSVPAASYGYRDFEEQVVSLGLQYKF
jgi:opacity protein-like surface antigen